jgi:hypothetical protein
MFVVECFLILALVLSGNAWILLDQGQMALIQLVMVPMMSILCGTIITYSLIHYEQNQQFRDVIFVIICVNVTLGVFMYLLTSPAMEGVSIFADRERNRTIVSVYAFILAPSALFGSISRDTPITKVQKTISISLGTLVYPLLYFWFFFSEEPVFILSTSEGPTIYAVIIFIIIVPIVIISIIKSFYDWWHSRDLIGLAFTLLLILTFIGLMLFAIQTNPLQIMEIAVLGSMTGGFTILTTAMLVEAIFKPRKSMRDIILKRTSELEQARLETEFYLNVWSHKIGNVLQGIIMYLDLITPFLEDSNEAQEYQRLAAALSTDADLINRQVLALRQVVKEMDYYASSIPLRKIIQDSSRVCEEMLSQTCLGDLSLEEFSGTFVEADVLLQSLFVNLFAFVIRSTGHAKTLRVEKRASKDHILVDVTYEGNAIPENVLSSLFTELQPSETTLSLDLYLVNLLMQRYRGSFVYKHDEESNRNYFCLSFRTASSDLREGGLSKNKRSIESV